MGAALGGGAAESAFGAQTSNILTKGTIYGIIAYFLVALALYLIYQSQVADRAPAVDATSIIGEDVSVPAATGIEHPVEAPVVEDSVGGTIEVLTESE